MSLMNNVPIVFGIDLNVHDKMTFEGEGSTFQQFRKDLAPGTVMWSVHEGQHIDGRKGETRHLWMVCPCGCGSISAIPVPTPVFPFGWTWDGNEEQPTLSPSIQKLTPCRWHGYLKKGVFESC